MKTEDIPIKTDVKPVTDTSRQLSAEEINAIVSQINENKRKIDSGSKELSKVIDSVEGDQQKLFLLDSLVRNQVVKDVAINRTAVKELGKATTENKEEIAKRITTEDANNTFAAKEDVPTNYSDNDTGGSITSTSGNKINVTDSAITASANELNLASLGSGTGAKCEISMRLGELNINTQGSQAFLNGTPIMAARVIDLAPYFFQGAQDTIPLRGSETFICKLSTKVSLPLQQAIIGGATPADKYAFMIILNSARLYLVFSHQANLSSDEYLTPEAIYGDGDVPETIKERFTQPTDPTLTKQGHAADSKAVGDAIKKVEPYNLFEQFNGSTDPFPMSASYCVKVEVPGEGTMAVPVSFAHAEINGTNLYFFCLNTHGLDDRSKDMYLFANIREDGMLQPYVFEDEKEREAASVWADAALHPTNRVTKSEIDTKQDVLISGNNIKTINGKSILGGGDLNVQGVSDYNELNNLPSINGKILLGDIDIPLLTDEEREQISKAASLEGRTYNIENEIKDLKAELNILKAEFSANLSLDDQQQQQIDNNYKSVVQISQGVGDEAAKKLVDDIFGVEDTRESL